MNKVILVGQLATEPELRATSNSEVCRFSVKTTEKWTDKDREDHERTEYHRIVVFGRLAHICSKYLVMDSRVSIEGKLQTRRWEENGQKKYATEIIATDVRFLDRKASETG